MGLAFDKAGMMDQAVVQFLVGKVKEEIHKLRQMDSPHAPQLLSCLAGVEFSTPLLSQITHTTANKHEKRARRRWEKEAQALAHLAYENRIFSLGQK